MKVSIVKDEKQSQALGAPVYVMELDKAAKEAEAVIRDAIALKASIEKAGSNWATHTATADLIKLGIPVPRNKSLGGNYVMMADAFAELLVSPFYEFTKDDKKLISISANLVAGAPWQGHAQKSRKEALELFAEFNEDTAKDSTRIGALAHWYKPFPFIQAGEGKNRVSLAQAHNIPYLAQNQTRQMLDASTLAIRKVWFSNHWLLQCSSANQISGGADAPFRLKEGEFLIPFPKLTVQLMKQYGVQERSRVFRFFLGYRFKRHMLQFLQSKSYGRSPWL